MLNLVKLALTGIVWTHDPWRRIAGLSLAVLSIPLVLNASCLGHAESYPDRTIKIVVPFPAGGPTDVAARLIAQSLPSRLGQNVIVENVSGAGGRIGAKAVAVANPDGYTVLLGGTNVNTIIGVLYKNPGFDPVNSFAPIAPICVDSMALVVSPHVPVDTLQEFVDYAKQNPGKLKYGAPPGMYVQFAAEYFKIKTGTDILFVPYKGGSLAITDALGGHIDVVLNPKSVLLPHIREGKLKPLAVTSERRWPELPDTPTMKEVGVTGFPTEIWFGLLAPAGTPAAIVDRLRQAINQALESAEVRVSLAKLGVEPKIGTAHDFAEALAEQTREWKDVVDATGINGD